MLIIQVVGLAVLSAILIIVIRQEKPEIAFLLSIIGLVILAMIIKELAVVVELLNRLAEKAQIDMFYFQTIIKIIGIAYLGEFGAEITRDSGESALAGKIELAAKILIMIISIPIMLSLAETIISLIPP